MRLVRPAIVAALAAAFVLSVAPNGIAQTDRASVVKTYADIGQAMYEDALARAHEELLIAEGSDHRVERSQRPATTNATPSVFRLRSRWMFGAKCRSNDRCSPLPSTPMPTSNPSIHKSRQKYRRYS